MGETHQNLRAWREAIWAKARHPQWALPEAPGSHLHPSANREFPPFFTPDSRTGTVTDAEGSFTQNLSRKNILGSPYTLVECFPIRFCLPTFLPRRQTSTVKVCVSIYGKKFFFGGSPPLFVALHGDEVPSHHSRRNVQSIGADLRSNSSGNRRSEVKLKRKPPI
jgi:hypothetical protein